MDGARSVDSRREATVRDHDRGQRTATACRTSRRTLGCLLSSALVVCPPRNKAVRFGTDSDNSVFPSFCPSSLFVVSVSLLSVEPVVQRHNRTGRRRTHGEGHGGGRRM